MPTPAPTDHPGARVRLLRLQAGLTQTGLADRLGRTQGWVSKVESGVVELDRISVVNEVAAILGAHPRDLVAAPGPGTGDSQDALLARAVLAELRRYDLPSLPGTRVAPAGLQQGLDVIHAARDRADYRQMLTLLPGVLTGARTLMATGHGQRRDLAVVVYVVACKAAHTSAYAIGDCELVALAGAAAAWAAGRAGDNATAAVAASLRARDMWTSAAWDDSRAVTDAALHGLDDEQRRGDPAALHVAGTLHLRAAITAARTGNRAETSHRLSLAREAADRLARLPGPVTDLHQTTFSPANVAIHEISAAVEASDDATALTLHADPDRTRLIRAAPPCRRAHHHLDLAQAYLWHGRREEALTHLEHADTISPQLIRTHPVAKATLRRLITAERASTGQRLRRLATRFNLP